MKRLQFLAADIKWGVRERLGSAKIGSEIQSGKQLDIIDWPVRESVAAMVAQGVKSWRQ